MVQNTPGVCLMNCNKLEWPNRLLRSHSKLFGKQNKRGADVDRSVAVPEMELRRNAQVGSFSTNLILLIVVLMQLTCNYHIIFIIYVYIYILHLTFFLSQRSWVGGGWWENDAEV